ncbi:MAG: CpaF family protein [bacterium]
MTTSPIYLKPNNGNQRTAEQHELYQKVKADVHRQLIEILNLGEITEENIPLVKKEVRPAVSELIASQTVPLNGSERLILIEEVLDEVFGLGPLEPLLKDTDISDILVNNFKDVYIEKHGKLEKVSAQFRDNRHLLQIIDRIVSRVGRRVDEKSPMVDARLPDGSRVNAIIPPLSLNGPCLSIRRFGINPLTLEDLLEYESIIPDFVELLRAAVQAKLNILISGGTGSGKTTLLNILSSFIPPSERIITIEDSAELIMQQPHVVRLETRPPNIEGQGLITQRDLLFNALRMRPDRIIVGEVRGGEALDMLQAMNTGHEGSLTTIHANSPRDSLSRVETMVSMAGFDLPVKVIRQQIGSAIDLVIQTSRLIDGRRRVTSISEVTGMEGDVITMQEIFKFQQMTVDREGNVIGKYIATGVRPQGMDRIEAAGIDLSPDLFEPGEILPAGAKS